MTGSNFSITSSGKGFFIEDTSTGNMYQAQSSDSGVKVEDAQSLLKGALDIIGKSGEEADLSEVKIGSEGIHIGERFVSKEDIASFDESYSQIDRSFSPVVEETDSVARDNIETHLDSTSATFRSANGEEVRGSSGLSSHDIEQTDNPRVTKVARGPLAKIGQFFKKMKWPSTLVKIAEFVEKIFAKERYIGRHTDRAQEYMKPTDEKVLAAKECQVRSTDDPNFAHIPDRILLAGKQGDYSSVDKKIEGKQALNLGDTRKVEEFQSGSHTVTAFDVTSGSVETGSVVPTSTRFAGKKSPVGNHLVNCYVTEKDGAAIIRTGVIDTPEKAAEFEVAVKKLHEQMGGTGPVRVMSHQLNSPEREGKMIKSQHRLLAAKNDDDVQIAHMNAPCNRFYHHTKAHGNKPILSSILTGEKKSHEQNVEGMSQYLGWILEDAEGELKSKLEEMGGGKIMERQREINDKFKEMNKKYDELIDAEGMYENESDKVGRDQLKAQIESAKKDIKQLEKEISGLRKKMVFGDPSPQGGMRALHKWMKEVLEPEFFGNEVNKGHSMRETMLVYRKLLGSQLEIEGADLERNQEHLMQFALDKQLGVITAMNCKSGLDRTGFLFALFLGAQDLPEDLSMKVALNWESYSLELNKLYLENDYDPKKVMAALTEPHRSNSEELKAVFNMQQNVLQHLLKVSLPITGISTGVIGLKYGKGMSENLLPLYCIPPVVKDESGNTIQLMNYSKSGKPKGLTDEGHRLITQLSPHRGA